MTQDATPTPLEALNATLAAKLDDSDAFYAALDHVEAEGRALLQTESIGEVVVGFIIHEIGEHTVRPAAPAPHSLELAQALPLAREGDTLHASEHAIVRAFLDVGDTLRHVYLNLSGLWVKA